MPHDSAAGAAPAGVNHKNHFRWVPAAVREETEARRGGQTAQGHRARTGPDPQAVCQSLPSPVLATGDLVERDMGSLPGAPVRGRKRLHSPSSAPRSSQKRCPSLAMLEGPCFIFITQHAPWRRPAGCLALQNLFIYTGAEGIGSFRASSRILSWGASHSCLQGPMSD